MVNPKSRYTFLNYLRENNRIHDFINLRTFYPRRTEFEDYIKWCTRELEEFVDFNTRVCHIVPTDKTRLQQCDLTLTIECTKSNRQEEIRTNSIILADGGFPLWPLKRSRSSYRRVFHSADTLHRLDELNLRTNAEHVFHIIGSGQSSADTFYYLAQTFPRARITVSHRSYAMRPEDDSHFVNELFMPDTVDTMYQLPNLSRKRLLDDYKHVTHNGVTIDLLPKLYELVYYDRANRENRFSINRFTEFVDATETETSTISHMRNLIDGSTSKIASDVTILATGYVRPCEHPLLASLRDCLEVDASTESYKVDRDYRVASLCDTKFNVFLQGYAESTHGFSESLLSLMAERAARIAEVICKDSKYDNSTNTEGGLQGIGEFKRETTHPTRCTVAVSPDFSNCWLRELQRIGVDIVPLDLERGEDDVSARIVWYEEEQIFPGGLSEEKLENELRHAVAEKLATWIAPANSRVGELVDALKGLEILRPGADSNAIWLLPTQPPMVLKAGNAQIIDKEVQFLEMVDELVSGVFPRIYSRGEFRNSNWYLMQAGIPDSGEEQMFVNRERTFLRSDWRSRIHGMTEPISGLYHQTLERRECRNAEYHYRRRIPHIFSRTDFIQTARKVARIECVNAVLDAELEINGERMPSVSELVERLVSQYESTEFSCLIHGDLHLKNMVATGGSNCFLVLDPRLQWDDEPVDKFGYGDPLYDMGTLLHSIGGMTTILRAIEHGVADRLIRRHDGKQRITMELDELLWDLAVGTSCDFPALAREIVPPAIVESRFEQRLYLGAANATIGWLKYANAVGTQSAWWTIYALGAVFLNMANGSEISQ